MLLKTIAKGFLLFVLIINTSFASNPALRIWKFYNPELDEHYIDFNPYIGNITAIYVLLKVRNSESLVRDYINWYLKHINRSDNFGLSGTIYDYRIYKKGKEKSLEIYDSVDGTSGTFLILCYLYLVKSADVELIQNNLTKLKEIAYTIVFLKDFDGLTVAIPKSPVKYLMDNVESYAGLVAFTRIEKILRDNPKEIAYYEKHRNEIKKAILENFWNPEAKNFFWAISNNAKYPSDLTKPYPDTFSQLFPIIYGLTNKNRNKVFKLVGKAYHEGKLSREQEFIWKFKETISDLFSSSP